MECLSKLKAENAKMSKRVTKIIVGNLVIIAIISVITTGNVSGTVGNERLSLGSNVLSSRETEMNSSEIGALTAKCFGSA